MLCRRVTVDDVAIIMELAKTSFHKSEMYDKAVIRSFCVNGQGYIHNRGYVLYEERKSDLPGVRADVLTLVQIGVCPTYRRRGVAQSLIRCVLHVARPVYLHVRSNNIAARQLYTRLKFVTLATLTDYYNSTAIPDAAYYMVYIPTTPTKLPYSHTWRRLE